LKNQQNSRGYFLCSPCKTVWGKSERAKNTVQLL